MPAPAWSLVVRPGCPRSPVFQSAAMVRKASDAPSTTEVTSAVVFYCLCSAGMLIVNKLAVHHLPLPGLVTACQFSLCSVFAYAAKLLGFLEMDDFEWDKAKYFLVYVLGFTIGTYTNMKVLSMANVETVIVFRSCTPLAVAGLDYIFYKRAAPSLRSCASLFLITSGAVGYIMTDREFQVNGMAAYYWVSIWWTVLVFQLTYGKFLVTGIKLKSLWTPVLYTNTFSILPALFICLIAGELRDERLASVQVTNTALWWLFISCAFGIGISWAGFWCQSLVSATTYTVVGVMNKMLTVTVNVLIWDKHASGSGIAALCLCLVGGSLYQQSPLRETSSRGGEVLPLRSNEGGSDHSSDVEGGERLKSFARS